MKFASNVAVASSALVAIAAAQVSYDNATDKWSCPVANGAYCAGDSLSTPVVILCTDGAGTPGNCIPHNWNRPPLNVYYSPCYQSSPTAGDAACAKDCIVYPDTGLPFPVPGSCNATYYDSIDVTGGAVTTSCTNGLLPNSNQTGTICSDKINPDALASNSTSSNSTSSSVHPTATSSGDAGSRTSNASPSTTPSGAAVAVRAAPMALVIGLAALAL